MLLFDAGREGLLWEGSTALRSAMALERASARAANNPVPRVSSTSLSDDQLDQAEMNNLVAATMAAATGGGDVH